MPARCGEYFQKFNDPSICCCYSHLPFDLPNIIPDGGHVKNKSLRFAVFFGLLLIAFAGVTECSVAQISPGVRPEYAYAVDSNANAVFGYRVGSTGALTPLAPPSHAAGLGPNGVAIDPTGRFMYVVNVLANSISGYQIGTGGSLATIPGSPFATGSGPGWVTVDPTGRYVYVANCARVCSGAGDGNVSGYAINKNTGALTPVPGSPFTADQVPYAIAVDPTGQFAYVANFGSGTVSIFKIDQCSGSLWSSVQSVATGGESPIALTIDPHGSFLFVTNTGSDNLSVFAVGNNGSLIAAPGSPFATGDSTQGVAVSPSGEFVYVTQGFQVLGFAVGAGGVLTPLPTSPYPAPGFLVSLTFDRSGHNVYAANASGVAGYQQDPVSGKLTVVTGSPFAAGGNTTFVATTMGH
jgi:6-phosphogluconolactonase